jgi:hypothetical protein
MQRPTNQSVLDFAGLFLGRPDVWGALQGRAIKERVTPAHYGRHLRGVTSLGIYPLTREGCVRWFAIDFDQNDPASALKLMEELIHLGIDQGIYLERSKGKGFHIIVFLSDWTPAVAARQIARAALTTVGLPLTTEIFPKQDRLTQQTPWGNYLNLPYFGGGNAEGRRMVLDPQDLRPIPLLEWLEQVTCFPSEALQFIAQWLPAGESTRRDPSPAHRGTRARDIVSGIHSTGTRRPSLVSLAGHLRVRGVAEDVAVALLLPWAREHCQPPLPDEEIEKQVRGIYQRYGSGNRYGAGRNLSTLEVG